METIRNLLAKTKHYLGVAIDFLKKLIGIGEKAGHVLDKVEEEMGEDK